MTSEEYHGIRQDETNRLRALRKQEAEVRRMTEERWQRRILPLLANENPVETDFGGCFE